MPRVRVATLVAAAVLAGLAGCADATPPELVPEAETGTLAGVVVDQAIRPLAGVHIGVSRLDRNATTDVDGTFAIAGVPLGQYAVEVHRPGYLPTALTAVVQAGRAAPIRIVLEPEPGTAPYVLAFQFEGFVECGTAHFAPCGGPNRASSIACANSGLCLGPITSDRFEGFFMPDPGITWLQSELVFENTQPLGDAMTFIQIALNDEERAQGFDGRYLNDTYGLSPVLNTVGAEQAAEEGLGIDSQLVVSGYGGPPGGEYTCVQDVCANYVGLILQQDFTVYTHVFYRFEPEPEWRFTEHGEPVLP